MLIYIDENDSRPIYLQIVLQIKEQIREGELKPGDELPSVRELADSLGINLHTVHHAYQKLRDQKIINLRLGQRARVTKRKQSEMNRDEIESQLVQRVKELMTEAYHLGLSADEFREFVNQQIALHEGGR
jgi:GntR family transcriptional regulator